MDFYVKLIAWSELASRGLSKIYAFFHSSYALHHDMQFRHATAEAGVLSLTPPKSTLIANVLTAPLPHWQEVALQPTDRHPALHDNADAPVSHDDAQLGSSCFLKELASDKCSMRVTSMTCLPSKSFSLPLWFNRNGWHWRHGGCEPDASWHL